MTSIRSSLESHTLLKATITTKGNYVVIQNCLVSSVIFGSRELGGSSHTHSIANTSSKWTSGSFNTRGIMLEV